MTETRAVISAREELDEALKVLDEADTKIQALAPETPDEEREFHSASFERAETLVAHAREKLERQIAIQLAKEAVPPVLAEDDEEERAAALKGKTRISGIKEPLTYRKDNARETSFLADVAKAFQGDPTAQERLRRHDIDTRDQRADFEKRDVTVAGGAAGFVPPLYMGELWAEYPRENRPFADICPKMDLPSAGFSITVPRLTTGTTVAVQQTEADNPSETDADETTLTVGVRLIAGQQDLSLQAFERTEPGFDQVVLSDLRNAYDEYLDNQLLEGTGSNAQHLGIRAVGSINSVTYTDATPSAAEHLPPVYDAIQKIASNRKAKASHIVMHPRRAAFIAAGTGSNALFQQGQLMNAFGSQDGGFVQMFAGLPVVVDSNINTDRGNPGTNQDEIYVVKASDLILMEGPLRVRALQEVLANSLQVKLQVFAYSAFISGRWPSGITAISGSGLATPSFA